MTSLWRHLWPNYNILDFKILTQCVKLLGEKVLQVWWWYLHWFRRYCKKTRGEARNSPPPPPVGRGLTVQVSRVIKPVALEITTNVWLGMHVLMPYINVKHASVSRLSAVQGHQDTDAEASTLGEPFHPAPSASVFPYNLRQLGEWIKPV